MTPLPKRRLSTRRQGTRRLSHKFSPGIVSKCPNCQAPYIPHTICPTCGYYSGKQVLTIKAKKEVDKP